MSVFNINLPDWVVAKLSIISVFIVCTLASSPVTAFQKTEFNPGDSNANGIVHQFENAQLTLIDNVTIATRDAGMVTEIAIQEGNSVKRGQIIFRLDRDLYESELVAAQVEEQIARLESDNEVDIQFAEKSSAVNRKVLERSQKAVVQYEKSVSLTELERLNLELQRSVLAGDQALHAKSLNELTLLLKQEQLNIADLRLRYRDILSPISGRVVGVLAQKGEWVAAGQPIARVIDPTRLRVEALIGQEFAFVLKPGQSAQFETRLGRDKQTAEGQIVFVSPEINPLTEEFLLWVEIDNFDLRFKPGLKGTLRLIRE